MRDQAAHDVGVAVAAEVQHGLGPGRLDAPLEPDLARAAAHLVGIVVRLRRQRRQHPAELDDVAIALVPVVQELEVRDDLVDGGIMAGRDRLGLRLI